MDINVLIKFKESYIPPRCRKPRYRETMASCTISIPVLSPAQAPIAFRHGDIWRGTIEYRYYEGTLYTRVRWSDKRCNAKGWWPYEEFFKIVQNGESFYCLRSSSTGGYLHTVEECSAELQHKYSCYVLIQGEDDELEVWTQAGEPRYMVATFGLGHNHAGTDYFIENCYNPNVCKDWYFTALQHNAVVAKALEVAAARGDTNSFESIKNGPRIEVLIQDAVRCNPAVEAGDGDPFLNQLEGIIRGSKSEGDATVAAIAAALMQ